MKKLQAVVNHNNKQEVKRLLQFKRHFGTFSTSDVVIFILLALHAYFHLDFYYNIILLLLLLVLELSHFLMHQSYCFCLSMSNKEHLSGMDRPRCCLLGSLALICRWSFSRPALCPAIKTAALGMNVNSLYGVLRHLK